MTHCGATRVGHQCIAPVEHHLDSVAVEPDAVLDGGHAAFQRVFDACVGLRVSHHLESVNRGLIDGGFDLIERERGMMRLVARRKHPA
jgi:hypothetical protein